MSRLNSSKRSTSGAQRSGLAANAPVPRDAPAASSSAYGWAATSAAPCARAARNACSSPSSSPTNARSPTASACAAQRRVGVVVGQLEARDHEQVVEHAGAGGLARELRQVRGEVPAVHAALAADDVVGDREHVEAGAAVQIAELAWRELAVAPRRMRVELAEQRLDLRPHRRPVLLQRAGFSGRWPRRNPGATTLTRSSSRASGSAWRSRAHPRSACPTTT